MKPVYIRKSCAVSAQYSLREPFLAPLQWPHAGRLRAMEPDYSQRIPALQLRRMNRMLKMAVFAGLDCLSGGSASLPEGIITGTSRGNLSGTERFLKDLIRYKEESLNPTPFIFSTYNMVNGAIALQTGINGYNQTFVHQGSSFELALFDAQLYFHERNPPGTLLVGTYDELTDDYFIIKNKPAWQKGNGHPDSGRQTNDVASIAAVGEGASFFLLGNTPEDATACLRKVHVFVAPGVQKIQELLDQDLQELQWKLADIDMLVLGVTGAEDADPYYAALRSLFSDDLPELQFKPFSGGYEGAGGFGIWLLLQYFSGKTLPEEIWSAPGSPGSGTKQGTKVLYYNHFGGVNHNFLFLEQIGSPGNF